MAARDVVLAIDNVAVDVIRWIHAEQNNWEVLVSRMEN
jgi:hypothetical protein